MTHAFKEKLEQEKADVREKVFEGQTHNYFIARNVVGEGEDPAMHIAKILKA